jgi:hypothetical protein
VREEVEEVEETNGIFSRIFKSVFPALTPF